MMDPPFAFTFAVSSSSTASTPASVTQPSQTTARTAQALTAPTEPEGPTRAPNCYLLYRASIAQKCRGGEQTALSKSTGKKWSQMSREEQEPWRIQAAIAQQEFNKRWAPWLEFARKNHLPTTPAAKRRRAQTGRTGRGKGKKEATVLADMEGAALGEGGNSRPTKRQRTARYDPSSHASASGSHSYSTMCSGSMPSTSYTSGGATLTPQINLDGSIPTNPSMHLPHAAQRGPVPSPSTYRLSSSESSSSYMVQPHQAALHVSGGVFAHMDPLLAAFEYSQAFSYPSRGLPLMVRNQLPSVSDTRLPQNVPHRPTPAMSYTPPRCEQARHADHDPESANAENIPLEGMIATQTGQLWQPSLQSLSAECSQASCDKPQQPTCVVEGASVERSESAAAALTGTSNISMLPALSGGPDLSILDEVLEGYVSNVADSGALKATGMDDLAAGDVEFATWFAHFAADGMPGSEDDNSFL
ncbi:hypothetical protein OH76DRAFT_771778 [Lentinus brumalis]|uniref:HMG box domain-containing protein n=1 Tax=Lentinus brumalis TaxID=2498619 RepID=A0A371D4T5_9APHY|nr:hypothetical protein OH76DRAFT_771778 [Polyporus brumalis]